MCIQQLQHRALGALALTSSLALSFATALAASTVPTGGGGGHGDTLLAEAMNTEWPMAEMGCYFSAALCFIAGVWAIWASRKPQNRESKYLARGVAGLLLSGLFVTSGLCINRAVVTFDVVPSSINANSSIMMTFK